MNVHYFRFQIDGLRCGACTLKVRQLLYEYFPSARDQVDQKTGQAQFWIDSVEKDPPDFEPLKKAIIAAGFQVSPWRDHGVRKSLIDLATAGYAAGNAMIIALAFYLNDTIDDPWHRWFQWGGLFFATLSLLVPARTLLINAWSGLRVLKINIDLPIVLGFWAAYLLSFVAVLNNDPENQFFDSICVGVFFILLGRWVKDLKLTQTQAKLQLSFGGALPLAWKKSEVGLVGTPIVQVKKSDAMHIKPFEVCPVECEVISAECKLDLSQINGEAEPQFLTKGQIIPAGAVILEEGVDAVALQDGASSLLLATQEHAARWAQVKSKKQSQAEAIAQWFVIVLLSVSWFAIGLQIGGSWGVAVERVVAMLLVACPCALGFAIPLLRSRALGLALQNGIIIKNIDRLESLQGKISFIFDKTGTLTTTSLHPRTVPSDQSLKIAYLAAKVSTHSISRMLEAFSKELWQQRDFQGFKKFASAYPTHAKEVLGKGVLLQIDGQCFVVGSSAFIKSTLFGKTGGPFPPWFEIKKAEHLKCCQDFENDLHIHSTDGCCLLSLEQKDVIREDALSLITSFKERGIVSRIFSGDKKERVNELGQKLGVNSSHLFGECSAAAKADQIKGSIQENETQIFVGNGLNDWKAMAKCDFSVAVSDSQRLMAQDADACLQMDRLKPLLILIDIGHKMQQVSRRVFLFSFSYNLTMLILALLGWVSPALAAVLMPISSIIMIHLSSNWNVHLS